MNREVVAAASILVLVATGFGVFSALRAYSDAAAPFGLPRLDSPAVPVAQSPVPEPVAELEPVPEPEPTPPPPTTEPTAQPPPAPREDPVPAEPPPPAVAESPPPATAPVAPAPVEPVPAEPEAAIPTAESPVAPAADPDPTPPPQDARPEARLMVTALALNLRAGPSNQSEIVAELPMGTPLAEEAESGRWLLVTLADGRRGWVHRRYVGERT